MLSKYIAEYKEGFDFTFEQQIIQKIFDINIKIDVMLYFDGYNHRQKADIVLEKGDLIYKCECIDIHNWEKMFHLIALNKKTFLCFRKTLYGFTFLNIDTLEEEYNYFPTNVLKDEESFIIIDAKSFGNIIIFDGCYWADLYSFFAYDHSQKLFLNLSAEFNINTNDGKAEIENNTLILTGEKENHEIVNLTVTQDELLTLIKKKGTSDF